MEASAVRVGHEFALTQEESLSGDEIVTTGGLPEGVRKLTPAQIETIVLDNRELGRRLAWSLLSGWRMKLASDDVISCVGSALCEAANRFDPDKGVAFKTFFFYHLRGTLLKEVARIIQEQKVVRFIPGTALSSGTSGEQTLPAAWLQALSDNEDPERIIQRKQLIEICKKACTYLDPLEQEVVVRSVAYDEALVDIADDLGYCRCHISRVKSRAMAKLGKVVGELTGTPERVAAAYRTLDESIEKVAPKKSKSPLKTSYTGGRGRRKSDNPVDQSRSFKKLMSRTA